MRLTCVRQMTRMLGVALVCSLGLTWSPGSAATVHTFSADSIPAFLYVGSHFVFDGTDTLTLSGRLLVSGVDYSFDRVLKAFDLRRVDARPGDTLVITYVAAPPWFRYQYGEEIGLSASVPRPPPVRKLDRRQANQGVSPPGSNVSIGGTKGFRFISRTGGGSEFGQSLDLVISGKLSRQVTIEGALSDRGYDPAYGTANSRLNELEQINLTVKSPTARLQIGYIEVESNRGSPVRSMSGASFEYRDQRLLGRATVARPKGRYASASFQGADNIQGPYRIADGNSASPIVPGSEEVWLNGQLLQRGSGKDYVMDYPTGRITFKSTQPIDSRSRIEIDYEPLTSSYDGEYFAGEIGGQIGDSSLYLILGWSRDGDDADRPLRGALTASERALLDSVGDNSLGASRSGVTEDSTGPYALVADSLPDTVFTFVGEGAGDFRIVFSFVGEGSGEYRFVGGESYEYVGAGNGDYLPVILVTAPRRVDHAGVVAGSRTALLGTVRARLQSSSFDQNLLSDLDDDDNVGYLSDISGVRAFGGDEPVILLDWRTRYRESSYRTLQRIDSADFSRRFLLPTDSGLARHERLHSIRVETRPSRSVTAIPSWSYLQYDDAFVARRGGMKTEWVPVQDLKLSGELMSISAHRDSTTVSRNADATTWLGAVNWQLSQSLRAVAGYENDRRLNEYSGQLQGTRYDRAWTTISSATESATWEGYFEDSLALDWRQSQRRHRLTLGSSRSLGRFAYTSRLSYQLVDAPEVEESSFLGNLNGTYRLPSRRLAISLSYLVSDETRNARGITYLEVDPGQGDFVFEDGRYVPDPNGNYIQVEELLSDRERVRRAEKSFRLSKVWPEASLTFSSRIEEELLEGGRRDISWLVPFVSDPDQPYLFYQHNYNADLRLIPVGGVYAVNLFASNDLQQRSLSGSNRRKEDSRIRLVLKQLVSGLTLEQGGELFRSDRDAYFSGGGLVEGWIGFGRAVGVLPAGEVSLEARVRSAREETGVDSRQYSLKPSVRHSVFGVGEIRVSLEGYVQDLEGVSGPVAYQLNLNRNGQRGVDWEAALAYRVRGGLRADLSVFGRHSDERTARITARGEVIASF